MSFANLPMVSERRRQLAADCTRSRGHDAFFLSVPSSCLHQDEGWRSHQSIRNMHMTVLDKFLAVVLIAIGVYAGWLFLDDLQYGSLRFDAGWTPPTATQQLVAVRFCTYTSSFW
jgi:hypothetical protein